MAEQGPLSGKILGEKYLLGDLLGEGGFGAVYSARHLLLDRPQAIKLLQERHLREQKFRERFRREAQTLAALDHPHIVHIDDFVMEEVLVHNYLVMPYVSGGTFRSLLRQLQEPLPLERVSYYLAQISSALDYAHSQGVVHLDLKPQNLLVHSEGRLLLSDFGLAHLFKQETLEGGSSLYHGTPQYMAPEHLRGEPDTRSDVYALGIILFEMLALKRPFEGPGPEAIMLKQLTAQPPSLLELRPDLPQPLDLIIQRVLAKNASDRYQTAGDLCRAFQRVVASYEEQRGQLERERQWRAIEEAEQVKRRKLEERYRLEVEHLRRQVELERQRRLHDEVEKEGSVKADQKKTQLSPVIEPARLEMSPLPQQPEHVAGKRVPLDAKEYKLKSKAQTRDELQGQVGAPTERNLQPAPPSIRQIDGSSILGADHPRREQLGLIYPGPRDTWIDIQTALHTQDKLGRKQIAMVLPARRNAFLWRNEFADLDKIRYDFSAQLIFIIDAGENAADLADLHGFATYPTLEDFIHAFLSGRLPPNPRPRSQEKSFFIRLFRNRVTFFSLLFTLPLFSLVLLLLSSSTTFSFYGDAGHKVFYLLACLLGALLPASSFLFPREQRLHFSLIVIPVVIQALILVYCPIMAAICLVVPGFYQLYSYLFFSSNYTVSILAYLFVSLSPALLMISVGMYLFTDQTETHVESPRD